MPNLRISYFFICLTLGFPLEASCAPIEKIADNRKPAIIMIEGPCSSGKSTLIKSLLKRWSHIFWADEDTLVYQQYLETVSNRYPSDYFYLTSAISENNLYAALRYRTTIFKETATQAECEAAETALGNIQKELNRSENRTWKKGISESINQRLIDEIETAIAERRTVIVDAWYRKLIDSRRYSLRYQSFEFFYTALLRIHISVSFKETFSRSNKET